MTTAIPAGMIMTGTYNPISQPVYTGSTTSAPAYSYTPETAPASYVPVNYMTPSNASVNTASASNALTNGGGAMDSTSNANNNLFSMQFNPTQMINSIVSGAQNVSPYFNFFKNTSSQIMQNFQASQGQAYNFASNAQVQANNAFVPAIGHVANLANQLGNQYAQASQIAASNSGPAPKF